MPAFSTHYLFANRMIDSIRQADASLPLCVSALYYGTQGPDFMFQHRILPWMKGKSLRDAASALHHCDPAKLFYYMGEYLQNEDCDRRIVKSYIYGFICHFSLDRIAHPYIYAVQKQITPLLHAEKFPGFVIHNKIELNIDALLLQQFLKKEDTRAFRTDLTLKRDDHLITQIGKLMGYVAPKVTGLPYTAQDYTQGFYDMVTMQRLLTDDTPRIRPLLAAAQLPLKPFIGEAATSFLRKKHPDTFWDYLNGSKMTWYCAAFPDKPRNESFCELFALAAQDACHIIASFDAAMRGEESFDLLTENMDFDSGTRFDA